jgi:arylsulfatase
MPWDVNVVLPFDQDKWELYNVEEDFSESTDLAAQYPEKLEELKQIFDEEAWKYNVYPLYDDMIKRLGAQQDRLFGDQTEFVYFAPGATRIAEKSSAPVKNRAHTIETRLDLDGSEEGVIVACGGMTGGYSMFIKGNQLYYDYNFLDGVHYILKSGTLPKGLVDLKFDFERTKPFGGVGKLFVNGKKVDEVEMPQMHIATYSLAETFDVGRDTGTQVSKLYEDPFVFDAGELDRVIIQISDESTVPPRKLPAVYY